MKKKIPLLLIGLLTITSCATGYKKIDIETNFDILSDQSVSFIELNENKIINKLKNKDDFILYLYSPDCFSCSNTNEALNEILIKENYTIYKYCPLSKDYNLLLEYDNLIFPEEIKTPRVISFKGGKLNLEINSGRLGKVSLLSKSISSLNNKNYFYTLTSKNSFLNFVNQFNNFYLINYSSINFENLNWEDYSNIKNLLNKNKKITLFLKEDEINDELEFFLKNEYGFFLNEKMSFSSFENNNLKVTYDFNEINIENIKNIII